MVGMAVCCNFCLCIVLQLHPFPTLPYTVSPQLLELSKCSYIGVLAIMKLAVDRFRMPCCIW